MTYSIYDVLCTAGLPHGTRSDILTFSRRVSLAIRLGYLPHIHYTGHDGRFTQSEYDTLVKALTDSKAQADKIEEQRAKTIEKINKIDKSYPAQVDKAIASGNFPPRPSLLNKGDVQYYLDQTKAAGLPDDVWTHDLRVKNAKKEQQEQVDKERPVRLAQAEQDVLFFEDQIDREEKRQEAVQNILGDPLTDSDHATLQNLKDKLKDAKVRVEQYSRT